VFVVVFILPVNHPEHATQIPTVNVDDYSFLTLALSTDFVMSSILAFSAAHLAWITRNKETEKLAYHHRGVAIKGLQKATTIFSKDTADAILAASILLSWQVTEW
jgi:hypothetical protein